MDRLININFTRSLLCTYFAYSNTSSSVQSHRTTDPPYKNLIAKLFSIIWAALVSRAKFQPRISRVSFVLESTYGYVRMRNNVLHPQVSTRKDIRKNCHFFMNKRTITICVSATITFTAFVRWNESRKKYEKSTSRPILTSDPSNHIGIIILNSLILMSAMWDEWFLR